MRSIAVPLTILATMLMTLLCPTALRAQIPETWVSGVGDDRHECTRTSPCRTFARAIERTSAGGRIGVLDAGNFGNVTINKAISITNDGAGEARVNTAGGQGIGIFAGPNDLVFLRGLTIDGSGVGSFGIFFGSGAALHVQNCVIRKFSAPSIPAQGIGFQPSGTSELYVADTVIAANGSSTGGGGGILIQPGEGGSATVVLNRVQLENNNHGIEANGSLSRRRTTEAGIRAGVNLTVQESVVAGHAGIGIKAITTDMGIATAIAIDRTSSVYNGRGIHVDGASASIRISNSTVTGNQTGMSSVHNGHLDYSRNNNFGNNGINVDELTPSGL